MKKYQTGGAVKSKRTVATNVSTAKKLVGRNVNSGAKTVASKASRGVKAVGRNYGAGNVIADILAPGVGVSIAAAKALKNRGKKK